VRALFFSGVDGSGKTTAVARAVIELRRCGVEPRILWMRSLHTLSYLVYALAERAVYGGPHPRRQFPEWARRAGIAWELLELASIAPHLAVLAAEKTLSTIVVDRGPADFVANVMARSGGRIVYSRPLLGLLARLYRGATLVYLRIPPGREHIAAARKGGDLDYGVEDLKRLVAAYEAVIRQLAYRGVRVRVLDSASLGVDDLKREVASIVASEVCGSDRAQEPLI